MTTDRELLELAAFALGKHRILCYEASRNCLRIGDRTSYTLWRPLSDYGHALHLGVTLQLDITHNNPLDNHRYVCASRCGIEMVRDPVSEVEEFDDESWRIYATCRAIVRAAAEIGKQTKEQTP